MVALSVKKECATAANRIQLLACLLPVSLISYVGKIIKRAYVYNIDRSQRSPSLFAPANIDEQITYVYAMTSISSYSIFSRCHVRENGIT